MEDYVEGSDLGLDGEALLCHSAMSNNVPSSAKEALQDPNWKKAMQDEYNSLVSNKVWDVSTLPQGRTAIGGKWHFVIKYGADGNVLKYKARYVAKGFTQVFGRDYGETYSPTVNLATIRCLLAVAAQLQCEVYQMDIKTAYLNAGIEEDIYMRQPEGFEEHSTGKQHVCHLKKSLYGLKQSGRNWYLTLSGYLTSLGFTSSDNDPCLFTKVIHSVYYYVCVWVDDIIYFSSDTKFSKEFQVQISKKFTIGDVAPLHWFLGMKIERQRGRIVISQQQYIETLLEKHGMLQCKPVTTPILEKTALSRSDCPEDGTLEQANMKEVDYRGLVGSLNYLATTSRPDIAYTAHALSSYLCNPGPTHWTAAKHALRYLRGTAGYQLVYQKDDNGLVLAGYSDADYAGHLDTRRSTSGFCFSVQQQSGCITWSSKLQPTVATSTAEAELNAAMAAAQEAIHLQQLLGSMGYPQQPPSVIQVDNQACIAMTHNPSHQSKTKHFAIKLCYTRELVHDKLVVFQYVPTDINTADVLAKGLAKLKTQTFAKAILSGDNSNEPTQ
jgi:hypothetical protein